MNVEKTMVLLPGLEGKSIGALKALEVLVQTSVIKKFPIAEACKDDLLMAVSLYRLKNQYELNTVDMKEALSFLETVGLQKTTRTVLEGVKLPSRGTKPLPQPPNSNEDIVDLSRE